MAPDNLRVDHALIFEMVILIRGAGEIASAIAHRLRRCGFSRIVMTETPAPLAVRRKVSFSEAVFNGEARVESVEAVLAVDIKDVSKIWKDSKIAVIVDPDCSVLSELRPDALVDAILAKRNTGVTINDAGLVITLGPGFTAGVDCHWLVETDRGHDLGRLIISGKTSLNTGEPGDILGQTHSRVLRAPFDGILNTFFDIGEQIEKGSVVCCINDIPIVAQISGVLRGILRSGSYVTRYTKIGDIDPRSQRSHCFTISDKARTISGSVLEVILATGNGVVSL